MLVVHDNGVDMYRNLSDDYFLRLVKTLIISRGGYGESSGVILRLEEIRKKLNEKV